MKRIGLLAVAIVLSLGLVGAGFAYWTETLTIEGDIGTGEVDVEFLVDPAYEYSGLAYKYYDGSWDKAGGNDPDWFHGSQGPDYGTNTLGGPVGITARVDKDVGLTTYELVDTDSDGDIDTINVTFHNAYPGYVSGITCRVRNNGTVPIKTKVTFPDDGGEYLFVCGIDISNGIQLEPGEFRKFGVGVVVGYGGGWLTEIEQNNTTDYHFTMQIEAVQWNEYSL